MALVLYRIAELDKKTDRIETAVSRVVDDHEARLRKAEDGIARLQERLAIVTASLTALTLVASAVAAWLGSLAK